MKSQSMNRSDCRNGAVVVSASELSQYLSSHKYKDGETLNTKLAMFSGGYCGLRVFCFGLTGYLVLTTTPILGVICYCHASHMSISRFCQHSGLSDVNPGNAVLMDTGVTIAHWRKLFFQKLGIKAPEDHGGWDWPEVFPVSTSSAEFYPSLPNLSPNVELSSTFGASNGARQSWSNMSISKNPQHPPLSNLNGIQDLGNGSSFVSDYIGSNSKDTNTFNSLPDLKISKSLGINSSLLQMDGSSVSSSIELRLGHPSQQSKKLGTLAPQTFEYHSIVKPIEYQQPLFPEPLMHKVESQAVEESKSNFHMLNLSSRSGKCQPDLVNSAYELHSATSESRTRNSIFPVVQAQVKGPSEGLLYSEDIKNMVYGSHTPSREPQCKSLTLKCNQIDFHCARGMMTNKEFNVDASCALGRGNSDKVVANNIVNLHSAAELNFGLYSKNYENRRTVKRIVEGISHTNHLALHENNLHSCKPCGIMMDMPDGQNTLNLYGKTSLFSHDGPFDNGNIRSVCKPMSKAAPPSQAVPLGFPSSSSTLIGNQTLQLSKKECLNGRQVKLSENPRPQTLHHRLEVSSPAPVSSSTTASKGHICRNPFYKAPTSINQLYEPSVVNMLHASKTAAVSAFSGVSDYVGKHIQTIAPITDQLEGFNFSALSRGASLRAQDSGVDCQFSSDFHAVHWPYLRHGGSEGNISPSVEQANYFPEASNSFMSCLCNCAVQPDVFVEKHHFIGEPLDTTQVKQNDASGCINNLFACKLNDSQKVPLDNVASLAGSDLMGNRINKLECHSSQWRDVKKVTGAVSLTFKEQTTGFLNMDKMRGQSADAGINKPSCDVAFQDVADAGGNKPSCDVAFQNIEYLKEPEISNVSSGGSAPVVSEASAVIHDNEFTTDDQKTVASNVVDEGSGINRCWSSSDAQGSEQSAEFLGVACEFNPMDAGPSKGFADNSSDSLNDELRLKDPLKLNKMQNHHIQKVSDFSKKVIRKRTKWRKLDTTLPTVYSACGYPEDTCGSGLQHPCNDEKGAPLSENDSAEKCVYSIEPSFRERRFRMRSLNTLSCTGKVNCHDAKAVCTQSDLLKVSDDDTFVACELPRRKRLKLDTATPVRQADEGYYLGVDAAAKCSFVDTSMFPEMHEKAYRRAVRPIVGQKYGVISNANPSKPVKVVSLRKICDLLEKYSSSGNSTAKLTSVKFRKASAKEKHRRINRSPYLKKVKSCNANCVITTKKSKSHLLTSSELDPCQSLEQSKRAHCHGGEQGAHLFYSLEKRRYDYLIETGNIADDSLPTPQKPLSKEFHKQGLNELTLEGIHPGEGGSTCARTEGYKGRKKEGLGYNLHQYSESGGGGLVAQEQLNAWIHITGQKPSRKEILRLPPKDVGYDYRKEYVRYKHSKGWKSLVVYKSGIHALGLYTSRFILQSEMVVEYVGEIVGLRVADKRENEYLSGKKLQYKSACYFFRIDQEHIIDATQKGGIARFVNHSCLPNCVARIISVRNEKKVVFFAERDIYPGEEITYDYNFNHEDEGEKIPCYCNSKNCRLYLN